MKIFQFFNRNLSKEFVWSVFLIFSLVLPFFSSLELVFTGTQGKSFFVCFPLWIFVISLFYLFPSFYDFSINVMFSDRNKLFINSFEIGSKTVTKYPKSVGLFYGLCFLALFAKLEFPEISSLFYVSCFLSVLKNLLLLPYLGYLALMRWISIDLNSKKLPIETWHEYSFYQFDNKIFDSLPLINNKKQLYQLQTRRNMTAWVQSMVNIPNLATLAKSSRALFGSSAVGGGFILATSSGIGTEQSVEINLDKADQATTTVFSSSNVSDGLKQKAYDTKLEAEKVKCDWLATHGNVPAPVKGVRNFLGSSEQAAYVERARCLAHKGIEIKGEHFREMSAQKPPISSVLEMFF
jgi:hypothetical protein